MNLTLAICSIQEEKEDALICVSATHVSLICTQKRWRRKEVKKIMKKKLLSVILAGFMVMGCLAGCTSNNQTVENEKILQRRSKLKVEKKQLLQLPGGVQIVKRKHLKTYLQNLKRHIQKLTSS